MGSSLNARENPLNTQGTNPQAAGEAKEQPKGSGFASRILNPPVSLQSNP